MICADSRPGAHAGGPAAALREVDLEAPRLVELALRARVIAPPAVGVEAVPIGVDLEAPVTQEGEIDLQLAGRPVRHGADPPVPAVAARDQDVVPDLGVEHPRLVPHR